MRYQESKEQSSEYLRLALPLMSKQAAAMHPISYAVWYEYIAGLNPPLREKLDALTQHGEVLDEQATDALYRQFVSELDEQTANEVSRSVARVLADVSHSAAAAGDQADRFGSALDKFHDTLTSSDSSDGLRSAAELARRDTGTVRDAVSALKARLDDNQKEIEKLREQVTRARQDALIDGLTGLSNRRGFDLALSASLPAQEGDGADLSLLLADVDHFKTVNDTYGHLLGDKVLRVIAQIIKANVKGKDVAARYGGEEFVVLLPDTPLRGAQVLAEKIRTTIAGSRIKRLDNNETLEKVTISLGVAGYRPGESGVDFVARADTALYAAKNQGRNRVVAG